MTPTIAKIIWVAGFIGWYAIRYPHERRARRNTIVRHRVGLREAILLACSFTGMILVPAVYIASGVPRLADYPFHPLQGWAGAAVFVAALWLFRRTHADLGRNWSVTLKVRDTHSLATEGIYRMVRHPMYAAFWLWALAQCLLLANWVAGPAGLVGFGILFFGRVGREEELMIESFGDAYRDYMKRTARIIPGIY